MQNTVQVLTTRMSGLTACLIETVKECRDPNFEHEVILMMPENFTMNGEQEIIDHVTGNGLLGIRIISPKSIFTEITDRTGKPVLEPISDFGRAVVISHILKQLHRQNLLEFYDNAIRQSNLPAKLAEQIDEFRDAGLTPDSLMTLAEHPEIADALRYKYRDIARIWATYLTEIDSKFLDSYQQWEDLMDRMKISGYFDNADFIVVGFSFLNQQLMRILAASAPLATSTRLIIVADDQSPDSRIFGSINNQLLSFGQYLFDRGIRMQRSINTHVPQVSPAIRYVEQTLFASGRKMQMPDMSPVSLYLARTPFIECQHCAQTLLSWSREGMRWREMAVAFSSPDILPDLLPMVLRDAGIPYTPPGGQSMLMNDYVQFVLYLVRAACSGYLQRDVIGMIKSGFCLTREDAMDLENYAIENGINRQKWLTPFVVPEQDDPGYAKVLRLEECRKGLAEMLTSLRSSLAARKHTGIQQAKAIYQSVIDSGAYEVLKAREKDYMTRGLMLEIDRDRQVFDSVNEVLNQMAVFSENRHLAIEEIPVLLESAFAASVVKSLPQSSDAVIINPTGMFLSSSIKGMIIMGMQDRDSGGQSTLISDTERQSFRRATNTRFGFTRQEMAAVEMERLANTVAVPRERLVFSCSVTKPDGSVLYPSSSLRLLTSMLKSGGYEGNISGGMLEDGILPYSPSIALERISTRLRLAIQGQDNLLDVSDDAGDSSNGLWQKALTGLYHDPQWHERTARMLAGLTMQVKAADLTRAEAHRLYPETNLSISRLETFASCPYRHFLLYGLRPVIRNAFSFLPNMKGEFYHSVMERYVQKASSLDKWPALTEAEMNALLDEVIGPLADEWKNGPLDVDALSRFHAQRIIRDVRRAAVTITRNFAVGQFKPAAYELRFGRSSGTEFSIPPIQFFLGDRTRITLNGQIDRLDLYQDAEGHVYYRVIDYKSSSHDLRDLALTSGLQLQIPIYLNAAQNAVPDAIPAGGLYQVIRNPLIDATDEDTEQIVRKMGSELKLQGIVLDDKEILTAMGEVNGKARSASLVTAVPLEEIRRRMAQSMENAQKLAEEIFSGNIQIQPVQYDINRPSPCEYCPGAPVCGIDPRLPNGRVRLLVQPSPGDDESDE
ncbi:MAG: PD-(D/E)XK nuclease family protein [Clostridia bacterium]|nr:PD-(D/E)XK nuclease family protein [Clostridia bacterium]